MRRSTTKRLLVVGGIATLAGLMALLLLQETRPNRIQLNVEYEAQIDGRACQSAAMAMFVRHLSDQEVTQEEIRELLQSEGSELAHASRIAVLRNLLPDTNLSWLYEQNHQLAWNSLKSQIEHGFPVILSTRFTESGHVILVVGYIEDSSRSVIAHDPAGEYSFEDGEFSPGGGDTVVYSFDKLFVKNRKNLMKDGSVKWAKFVVGTNHWVEPANVRKADIESVEELKDWEFIKVDF